MPEDNEKKMCFVIGPIGAEGTDVRAKADWVLKEIIQRVLATDPFNYDVKRADQFTEPGLITDQVITAVIDADLAVADLTGHNANAFYELAVRHMEQKPVIHLAEEGEALPFDIKDYRAIVYRLDHPDNLQSARDQLAEQVKAIEDPAYKASNPITKARGHQQLVRSPDSRDQALARLSERVDRLEVQLARSELPQPMFSELSRGRGLSPSTAHRLLEALRKPPPGEDRDD